MNRSGYTESDDDISDEHVELWRRTVAEFRKRYPAEPVQPPAAWYDEPPFLKNGTSYPCWVEGDAVHADVYWDDGQWWVWIVGSAYQQPLNGRRVSPIVKPQEPPQ